MSKDSSLIRIFIDGPLLFLRSSTVNAIEPSILSKENGLFLVHFSENYSLIFSVFASIAASFEVRPKKTVP